MVANWLKLLQWTEMAANQILRLIESVPFLALFRIPSTAMHNAMRGHSPDKKLQLLQRRRGRVIFAPRALISRMHLPLPMPAVELNTDGSVVYL